MNNTLSSVTENFMTDGIFTYLVNSTAWTAPFSNAIELNLQYYGNISGDKPISPLVNKLLGDNEDPPIARVSAVNTSLTNQFIFDSFFNIKMARPMPMYSVPGIVTGKQIGRAHV